MARLWKNGENGTAKNGKFVFSRFLPISHIFYTFPTRYFWQFPTISYFPPFSPISSWLANSAAANADACTCTGSQPEGTGGRTRTVASQKPGQWAVECTGLKWGHPVPLADQIEAESSEAGVMVQGGDLVSLPTDCFYPVTPPLTRSEGRGISGACGGCAGRGQQRRGPHTHTVARNPVNRMNPPASLSLALHRDWFCIREGAPATLQTSGGGSAKVATSDGGPKCTAPSSDGGFAEWRTKVCWFTHLVGSGGGPGEWMTFPRRVCETCQLGPQVEVVAEGSASTTASTPARTATSASPTARER